ncbi:L-histidine N(alpha)-methyltransferase [Streptomyces sp. NBC_01450]|uniref:L-histidine N(alpha)-methyltransferase n=1 Tax=Streptomyces sp. NBC_01450 TaxID=2903871 RepID=UPI003FCE52FC
MSRPYAPTPVGKARRRPTALRDDAPGRRLLPVSADLDASGEPRRSAVDRSEARDRHPHQRLHQHPGRRAPEQYAKALRTDIRDGLTRTPKATAPAWFYDARGSELFEQINQLRKCPLWRAVLGVFLLHARDIAERTGARSPRGALLGE